MCKEITEEGRLILRCDLSMNFSQILGKNRGCGLYAGSTCSLENTVVEKHDVSVHAFADDMQLCLHCHCADTALTAGQLEQCIADVGRWMSAN